MKASHLIIAFILTFSEYASATTNFTKPIKLLEIHDHPPYSTAWTAIPLRGEAYENNFTRVISMKIAIFEDGKRGDFQGIVTLQCNKQINFSRVDTGTRGSDTYNFVSLKTMIDNEIFPKEMVNNLFKKLC